MYKRRCKEYGFIAIIYYLIYLIGLIGAGILFRKGIHIGMNIIYCLLFVMGIMIALFKDKSFMALGFERENIKRNFVISVVIVVVTFLIICLFSDLPFRKLLLLMLYYLFYIAAIEEILFRGLIQNYLFGFKANKYVIFFIGAIFFSFMHIPFQMFVHNNISLSYMVYALPNLLETFISHFIFCYIAYKCRDLTIPIALHYAYNFLGVIV